MIIEDVIYSAYTNEREIDWQNTYSRNRPMQLDPRRGTNPYELQYKKYKITKAKKITLEESDKKAIIAALDKYAPKIDHSKSVLYLNEYIENVYLAGVKNKHNYGYLNLQNDQMVCKLNEKGFYPKGYDAAGNYKQLADSFTFYFYKIEDKEELPFTPKEKEYLQVLERRSRMTTLNTMAAKDVILKCLNDKGYEIEFYPTEGYFGYTKPKGWNKLIKDALEYYINNEVLKGMNCKMEVPKVPNQHKYNFSDKLAYIGDVVIESNEKE